MGDRPADRSDGSSRPLDLPDRLEVVLQHPPVVRAANSLAHVPSGPKVSIPIRQPLSTMRAGVRQGSGLAAATVAVMEILPDRQHRVSARAAQTNRYQGAHLQGA